MDIFSYIFGLHIFSVVQCSSTFYEVSTDTHTLRTHHKITIQSWQDNVISLGVTGDYYEPSLETMVKNTIVASGLAGKGKNKTHSV